MGPDNTIGDESIVLMNCWPLILTLLGAAAAAKPTVRNREHHAVGCMLLSVLAYEYSVKWPEQLEMICEV